MRAPTPERLSPRLLALFTLLAPAPAFAGWWDDFTRSPTWHMLQQLFIGLLVLFFGWLLAKFLSRGVYWALTKTEIDNKIAAALKLDLLLEGTDPKKSEDAVERFISKSVYYILMLLVVISALNFAGLTETAGSLRSFVDTVIENLPLLGKAVAILVVAWAAAWILRKIITGALKGVNADARLAQMSGGEAEKTPLSETAGSLIFWLVMLIGLAGAMEALQIEVVAGPLRNALNMIIEMVPVVAVAALIVLVGYVLGRIAQAVVSNLLSSMGFNGLMEKVQVDKLFGARKGSDVVGLAIFYIIIFQAVTVAVDRLGLDALSTALGGVLGRFWDLIPALLVSALILAVGVVAARVVRNIVEGLLTNVDFDGFLERMGVGVGRLGKPAEGEEDNGKVDRPSRLIGAIVQLVIILVATAQVLENLHLETWTSLVYRFLDYTLWNLLVAALIVAVGLMIGNYVKQLIAARAPEGEDGASTRWMATAARAAVLVFAVTMALQQLNVASDFVLVTFALLFGALCLALALAFGLGSREVASDIVKRQYDKNKKKNTPGGPGGPRSPLSR
ncbi:MAG: mechanosensitive ion channel [Bradymonadia bacterium]